MPPPISSRRAANAWLALVLFLSFTRAFAQPATTYVDVSSDGAPPVIVAPDETVTFAVNGMGCRRIDLDTPPTLVGDSVDFILAFNDLCFATPPGFYWSAATGPLRPGTYTARYFVGNTAASKRLVASRSFVVAHRPDRPTAVGPGLLDAMFGTAGMTSVPVADGAPYRPVIMLMQPDGRIVATSLGSQTAMSRVLDRGAIDLTFASDVGLKLGKERFYPAVATLESDGSILIGGVTDQGFMDTAAVYRVSADGDTVSRLPMNIPAGLSDAQLLDIADANRQVYLLLGHRESFFEPCDAPAYVLRLGEDGVLDTRFGSSGMFTVTSAGCARYVTVSPDGNIFVSGVSSTGQGFVSKLGQDGSPDATFGVAGSVVGSFAHSRPVPQQDGGVVVALAPAGLRRLDATGAADPAFQPVTLGADAALMYVQRIAQRDDGGFLVAALELIGSLANSPDYRIYQPALFAVKANGTPDASFGPTGRLVLPMTYTTSAPAPSDAMEVIALPGGRSYVGVMGTASAPSPWPNRAIYLFRAQGDAPVTAAVEFHYPTFDHYFLTANAAEIASLDSGATPGWERTGQTFNVYPSAVAGAVPVCRFFSTAFAPRSSHFFTPDPAECAAVEVNGDWLFEGTAFYLYSADAVGKCPAGTRPVFREYNNGQGGAPNHRYTTNPGVRDTMLSLQWIAEGRGSETTFMCALQ